MSIEDKFLKVTMPDGSKWKVPVRVIIENRAIYASKKLNTSLETAIIYTISLFEEDEYEIEDWASNNMDWEDVSKHALRVKDKGLSQEELQDGWINGEKEIIEE